MGFTLDVILCALTKAQWPVNTVSVGGRVAPSVLKPSCSACWISPPTPSPWESGKFCHLHGFGFPKCKSVRIKQQVTFSEYLLSHSHVHLSFLYILSWFDSSVLLVLNNIPLFVIHSLFIHLPRKRHPGFFHSSAVVNKSSINMCVHVLVRTGVFISFEEVTRRMIAGFFFFWTNFDLCSA